MQRAVLMAMQQLVLMHREGRAQITGMGVEAKMQGVAAREGPPMWTKTMEMAGGTAQADAATGAARIGVSVQRMEERLALQRMGG
ncbi:hypothetical protein JKP88DRAFT_276128 [Tribonema minus]|uniref:Uncharacterized protein n=1 Tax=Tribonema minus TaxID=303371 RepID=A0A835Z5G6_9STRA|nr:hypothetical protein JKP88DRAFT_276128 [Tribonema minus]